MNRAFIPTIPTMTFMLLNPTGNSLVFNLLTLHEQHLILLITLSLLYLTPRTQSSLISPVTSQAFFGDVPYLHDPFLLEDPKAQASVLFLSSILTIHLMVYVSPRCWQLPNVSLQPWSSFLNSQFAYPTAHTSLWISDWHLKLSMSKTELLFPPYPPIPNLPASFPFSFSWWGLHLSSCSDFKNLELSLTLLFLSHFITNCSEI